MLSRRDTLKLAAAAAAARSLAPSVTSAEATRLLAEPATPVSDVNVVGYAFAGGHEAGIRLCGEPLEGGAWRLTVRSVRDGGPERDVTLPADVAAALMGAVQGVLAGTD